MVAAAKVYKDDIFTPTMNFLKRVGLLTEKQIADKDWVASYVPQSWRYQDIMRDPLGFIDFVKRNKQLEISDILAKTSDPATRAEQLARNIQEEAEAFSNKIKDSPNGIMTKQILDEVRIGGGAELHRDLKIHRSLLDEAESHWLENDIDFLASRHTRSENARALIKERFGSVNMEKQLDEITKDYDVLIRASTNPQEQYWLEIEKQSMKRDVAAMRDRLLGIYRLPENPYSIPHRISEALLKMNPMRALGGVMISSIPDLGRFVSRYGAGYTAKMVAK